MKKVLASALVVFMAMGCSKSEDSGVAGGDALTFRAAAPSTRAYFPGESGLMYWDNYDNIAAYSFDNKTLLASDFCAITPESAGTNEGQFKPTNILTANSWTASQADSKTATFYAYYPATNAAATYDKTNNGVLLNIPTNQSDEFGRSQICFSKGVEMTVAEIKKSKLVRFAFEPASSLLRVRFALSEDSDLSETHIKQLTISASGVLGGDCLLDFADGSLTPRGDNSTISVVLRSAVKITKKIDENPYIYVVLMPSSASVGTLSFTATTSEGVKLTVAQKSSPADGFKGGMRYSLDREIAIKVNPDSPDASYIDGGDAWGSQIVEDGSYNDAGNAW